MDGVRVLACSILAILSLEWGARAASNTIIYTKRGPSGEQFGRDLAVLGDLNGDGISEFAVGAPGPLLNYPPYCDSEISPPCPPGSVYIYSGRDGTLLRKLDGSARRGFFGWALDRIDDDLLIGAPGENRAYRINPITGFTQMQIAGSGDFGYDVACSGDLDGDLRSDYLISAVSDSRHGPFYLYGAGSVSAFSSKGALLFRIPGFKADWMGWSLRGNIDIDNDFISDILVGALQEGFESNSGGVFLFSGGSRTQPQILQFFSRGGMHDSVGNSVDFVDDIDGDHTLDILVASARDAFVVSSADGSTLRSHRYQAPSDRQVRNLEDFNGDHVREYAVSSDLGVHIYSGGTGVELQTIDSIHHRVMIEVIDDLDGDQKRDFILSGSGRLIAVRNTISAQKRAPLENKKPKKVVHTQPQTRCSECHF